MRFSYQFSNILGSVYNKGNLVFFPDGNRLLSPCGNKIVIYDLKNGKSEALPFETQYDVARMCLNPNASLLLVATEHCQLYMTSMISGKHLRRKDYKDIGGAINDLQFSPNGRYYAVCGVSRVLVYLTPGSGNSTMSLFRTHKMIRSKHQDAMAIHWNDTSQLLAVTYKDFSMQIYPIDRACSLENVITLTAHSDLIVGAFFANDRLAPLNLYSISRNGQLFCWHATHASMAELEAPLQDEDSAGDDDKLNYTLANKKYVFDDLKEKNSATRVTNYSHHPKSNLLVIGFNHGAFLLYELQPESGECVLIHSLQLSTKGPIDGIVFNTTGQWIAIGGGVGRSTKYDVDSGVSTQTQLIVWEWQSESFVLKQSGYASGVTNSYECLAYSPDASQIITGGTDGRLKVWDVYSGFCTSTFATEHKAPVTALEFVPGKNGKVFVSASLDGTLKVFDLNRYRCFRTLSGPNEARPAQFISLAIDKIGGDLIAAGSHNFFEIFLWSLKTGRLLETLTGKLLFFFDICG